MKCKDCGAKIPDNKKFCIDCGAWVNPPEEKQCIHNNYYDPERYRYNSSVFKNPEQTNKSTASYNSNKSKNIKTDKVAITLSGIIFAVLLFFIAGSILINNIDKFFSFDTAWEDTFIDNTLTSDIQSVDFNDGYADEQEQLALEYAENYIEGMDYETFNKFTSLDTEKVYRDIMQYRMDNYNFSTEEQFFNNTSNSYDEPVSDIHGQISADIKSFIDDKFVYYNTEEILPAVTYSYKIDSETLYEYYYSTIDETLNSIGRKTSDYLYDYNSMTDIYDICVDFLISDGADTYCESAWIVVANTGNGAEIVYDSIIIEKMLNEIYY